MSNWQNADGLIVQFGPQDEADTGTSLAPSYRMVVNLDATDLPSFTADLDNDGTNDGFSSGDAAIPAGAYITSASIVVTEAFAGGTSINFGLYQLDGTVIDADGIDAGVLTAALAANLAVPCDGALVGGVATVGAADGYFVAAATGTFTAGKAKLVIDYILV